jgi:anti-sigma regulatory factor (Ser/Thr protein kinase)
MTADVARWRAAVRGTAPDWLLSVIGEIELLSDRGALLRELDAADPGSAGVAREFTEEACGRWGLAAVAFEAQLLVSELVTNAIVHGTGPIRLHLFYDRSYFACAVHDLSERVPLIDRPDEFSESGRGLQLVEAIAAAWCWMLRAGEGKLVWASMIAESAGAPGPAGPALPPQAGPPSQGITGPGFG